MESNRSLTDFAQETYQRTTGFPAWLPSIPEWDEVLSAWQAGTVTESAIRRWLIEERGYSPALATRNKVSYLPRNYPRPRGL